MNIFNQTHKRVLFIILLICAGIYLKPIATHAATKNISVNNNDETRTVSVNAGDTGKISPNLSYIEDQSVLQNCTYEFESNDTDILQIDNSGNFTALKPGTSKVNINIYIDGFYQRTNIFTSTIQFTIGVDMTNVTLSTYDVNAYMCPDYGYGTKPYYHSPETQITVNSDYIISDDDYYGYDNYYNNYNYYNDYNNNTDTTDTGSIDVFSYTCSNTALGIEATLYNNIITITQSTTKVGNSQITFNIYGKTFTVIYHSSKLGISKQSYLLVKGKKVKLNITGYTGDILWSSSNPSIATVDSNGNVKGKKIGNVIIKAKVGEQYLGCAVSVTKSKLKKVAARATYIGTHWKYSQALRTKKGYYDCSALVWKAYKEKAKITFGSPWYPGVALSEAKWCRSHGKMIKGGLTYKKIMKMQVNPGDLLFKSTNMKKKYDDIYHVEMFTGYYCNSVNSDGTANFSPLWAARGSYYSFEEKSLLGRPMK